MSSRLKSFKEPRIWLFSIHLSIYTFVHKACYSLFFVEIIWSSLLNLENVQSNLRKERKVGSVTPVEVSQRDLGIVLW